ncbi:class I SAM-dependent methyltransferase [Desulforhopalus sp. 52FAK]
MKRVPEPALMNDPKQAAAYAGRDLDNAYWLFEQLFRKYFPHQVPEDAILDLGCGPAAIPMRLAKLFHNCQIHCVDGAPQMLAQGQQAALREGLEKQIHFFLGNLPDKLPLPQDKYKTIISNSFLHHLTDPMILWDAIHTYCLPGGAILIVDLVRPTSKEKAQHLVDQYMPNAPSLLRHDMLLSLLGAYTLDEVKTQLEQANLAENIHLSMTTTFQFAAYGYVD